jgi:hypothetical protein
MNKTKVDNKNAKKVNGPLTVCRLQDIIEEFLESGKCSLNSKVELILGTLPVTIAATGTAEKRDGSKALVFEIDEDSLKFTMLVSQC